MALPRLHGASLVDASTAAEILVASSAHLGRHYGGTLMLAEELAQRGHLVRILGPLDDSVQPSSPNLQLIDTHRGHWHGSSRRLAQFVRRFRAVFDCVRLLRSADVVICAELGFVWIVLAMRALRFTSATYVQSCGELYETEVGPVWRKIYLRSSRTWDALIDVSEERLSLRRTLVRFDGPGFVLLNTAQSLPTKPKRSRQSVPVLVYAGSVNPNADLPSLGRSLAMVDLPFVFRAYLFGEPGDVSAAKRQLDFSLGSRVEFRAPIAKEMLAKELAEGADVALVHYPPRSVPSHAQRLCAPGKVFDYLAAGVPIVTSSNPGLQEFCRELGVGEAASDDTEQSFARAVERMLERLGSEDVSADRIQQLFARRFAVDVVVPPVADWLEQTCGIQPGGNAQMRHPIGSQLKRREHTRWGVASVPTACIACETGFMEHTEEIDGSWLKGLYLDDLDVAIDSFVGNKCWLLRCASCHHESFEGVLPGDENFYEQLSRKPGYYDPVRAEFGILARRVPSGSSVLDIGCGIGELSRYLDQGADYTGLERNTEARAAGLALGRKIEDATLEELVWSGRHFDAIFIMQVLEHVLDPVPLLRSAAALLNPTGSLFVSVPNHHGFYRHRGNHTLDLPPHHMSRFTLRSVLAAGNCAGLMAQDSGFTAVGNEAVELLQTRFARALGAGPNGVVGPRKALRTKISNIASRAAVKLGWRPSVFEPGATLWVEFRSVHSSPSSAVPHD